MGLKEFKENLIKFEGDEIKALKATRFYDTMSKKGFDKIADIWDVGNNLEQVLILLRE